MKLLATLFLASVSLVASQTITTKQLVTGTPIEIALNPAVTTTLLFPSPISGVFGLGLVTGTQANGIIQVEHPAESNILVLHPLTNDAHAIATILSMEP